MIVVLEPHRKVVVLSITATRVWFTHKRSTLIIFLSSYVSVLLPAVSSIRRHRYEVFWYAVYLIPTVYSQIITPFLIVPGARSGCGH